MAKPARGYTLCAYCKQPGHHRPRCEALARDAERGRAIDAENAARHYEPEKNPSGWVVTARKREAVRAQIELALGELHDNAPSRKHLRKALLLLEEIR